MIFIGGWGWYEHNMVLFAEKFVASVKLCYDSRHVVGPSASSIGLVKSTVYSGRKRVKNTSGPEVSPGTFQSQPLSKRCTGGLPGRRLAFTICKKIIIMRYTVSII